MSVKKKARIEVIDIAKAITIFLVIMGHSTGNSDTAMFRRVLYAFHMPLFFFLAGLSIKPRKIIGWQAWKSFIRKNILALVFPYFIWGLIYSNFSFLNILKLLYGSWDRIAETGTLTSLWYLPCLFAARIYVQIIINIFAEKENHDLYYALTMLAFFTIGFVTPYREGGYFFCCDVALVAAAFILAGIICRKNLIILSQQKLSHLMLGLAAAIVLFYCGTIRRGDALELSLMCRGVYGNIFWFLLNSISGSMIVLLFSMILSQYSRESARPFSIAMVTYIGTHTMGIFLLHKNILQALLVPLFKPYISNELLLAIVASLVDLPIVLFLCHYIERYIPELLGEFPVYEHNS